MPEVRSVTYHIVVGLLAFALLAAAPAEAAYPSRAAVAAARAYAEQRSGRVAFTVSDTGRRLRGLRGTAQYRSASLSKAMLMVAALRRAATRGLTGAERATLGPMIRRSENDAATRTFRSLGGDEALRGVARAAGMTRFGPAGAWSEARLTANDQARFFAHLPRLVPRRHRAYALTLLRGIVPTQRWGISEGAPGWDVAFKGGWRRNLSHQAGRLQRGEVTLAVAVMTDDSPSQAYGRETIRGIVRRLLRRAPAPTRLVGK